MRSAGRRLPFEHAAGLTLAPAGLPAASAAASFPTPPLGIERLNSGKRPWSAIIASDWPWCTPPRFFPKAELTWSGPPYAAIRLGRSIFSRDRLLLGGKQSVDVR